MNTPSLKRNKSNNLSASAIADVTSIAASSNSSVGGSAIVNVNEPSSKLSTFRNPYKKVVPAPSSSTATSSVTTRNAATSVTVTATTMYYYDQ
jgi:hypothetical protein